MNAVNGIKVFEIDDCWWWAAKGVEEARADYCKATMADPEELEARELTDAELDGLVFRDTEKTPIEKRTFREQLELMTADKSTAFPCVFACSEY